MNANILSKGMLALSLTAVLALSACGSDAEADRGTDHTIVQTPTSDGGMKPADPSADLTDLTSPTAQTALELVCNGLSTEEAAEVLGVPETITVTGQEEDESGDAYSYCLYMVPGSEDKIEAGVDHRGDHWLTVFLHGPATTEAPSSDVMYGVAEIPNAGIGSFGGDDDTTFYISPEGNLYEYGFAVSLPHKEMDYPTVDAFQTATVQAAEAALNN